MTTKQPDWEAIERAYRAGLLSVHAITGIQFMSLVCRAKGNVARVQRLD